MNTALEQLLRPRLVLAVIVVIAATAGLLMDQLTGSEIIKALEAGQIQDPAVALAFEASRRKRGPVLVALTKAVAGVDDEEPKRTRAAGTAQSRRVPEGQEAI